MSDSVSLSRVKQDIHSSSRIDAPSWILSYASHHPNSVNANRRNSTSRHRQVKLLRSLITADSRVFSLKMTKRRLGAKTFAKLARKILAKGKTLHEAS